jgi:hypothetical protein
MFYFFATATKLAVGSSQLLISLILRGIFSKLNNQKQTETTTEEKQNSITMSSRFLHHNNLYT